MKKELKNCKALEKRFADNRFSTLVPSQCAKKLQALCFLQVLSVGMFSASLWIQKDFMFYLVGVAYVVGMVYFFIIHDIGDKVTKMGKDWMSFRRQLLENKLIHTLNHEYLSEFVSDAQFMLGDLVDKILSAERDGRFRDVAKFRKKFCNLYNLVQRLGFELSSYHEFFKGAGRISPNPTKKILLR
jgi:hypothetical protein